MVEHWRFGVADKILMLENAVYSILSPEGYASILWKDSSKAKEASEVMKMTAKDLYNFKVIDEIIKEPVRWSRKRCKASFRKYKKGNYKSL